MDHEGPEPLIRDGGIDAAKSPERVVDRGEGAAHRGDTLVEVVYLPAGYERVEIHPHKGNGHRNRNRRPSVRDEPCCRKRAGRVSKDSVRVLHEPGDDRRKIRGVVLGIVCRWRHVFAVAMPTEVEKHAAKLAKLPCGGPPNAAVAAVAMQAEERYRVRRRQTSRRPDYFVRKRRPRAAESKVVV